MRAAVVFVSMIFLSACGGRAGAGAPPAATAGSGGAADPGGSGGSGGEGGTGGEPASGGSGGQGGEGGQSGAPACDPAWPGMQWGTSSDDEVTSLAALPGGGLMVGGFERGLDGLTDVEPTGDSKGFVLSLDASGNEAWRFELDGPQCQTIEAITPEAGGTTLFAGRTESKLGATFGGQFDAVFGRLDAEGKQLSLVEWGDERPEHPTRIIPQGDRILVAGYDDLWIDVNYVADWEHGLAWGLDAGLGVSWSQKSDAQGRLPGLAVSGDGIFVAGSAVSRSGGVFVRRLDADGKTVWTVALGRVTMDSAAGVVMAPNGDVVVAGTVLENLTGKGLGNSHAFVAAIDPRGFIRWVGEYGSGDGDYITGLATSGDDRYWISGVTLGSVVDGQENAGATDAFAIEIDGKSKGKQLRAVQIGTAGDDWASAIAAGPCGGAYLGGWTTGAIFPGAALGRRDAFVVAIPEAP